MIIGDVPWKLRGIEFFGKNEGYELAILKEWFHWACESRLSILLTGPCEGLKGLLKICEGVGEENWELIGWEAENSEIKIISCRISSKLETVWIGLGNLELLSYLCSQS